MALAEDGEIEFDTDLPDIDPGVVAAYERVTGESLDEPDGVVETRGTEPAEVEEEEVDWRAAAEEARIEAAKANNAAAQARMQQREINRRIDQLIAAQQAASAPKPEAPPEIDFDEDPKGWIAQEQERTRQSVEALRQDLKPKEPTPEERQYQQLDSYMSTAKSAEQQFAAEQPDYYDAVGHAQKVMADQMKSIYGDAPLLNPQTGEPILTADGETVPRYLWEANKAETAFVSQALQQGQNPAAVYYEKAKQWGYQGGEQSAPGNPQAAAIKHGLANNRSLSKSSGAGTRPKANEMTIEEFNRLNSSTDPEEQAWVSGIWHHDGGVIANQILKQGKARIPDSVKPLRL